MIITGTKKNQDILLKVLDDYNNKEDLIFDAFQDVDELRSKDKAFFKAYIKSFFKLIKRLDRIEYTQARIPTVFRISSNE